MTTVANDANKYTEFWSNQPVIGPELDKLSWETYFQTPFR